MSGSRLYQYVKFLTADFIGVTETLVCFEHQLSYGNQIARLQEPGSPSCAVNFFNDKAAACVDFWAELGSQLLQLIERSIAQASYFRKLLLQNSDTLFTGRTTVIVRAGSE